MVAGKYYGSPLTTTANFTMTEDVTYYTPFYLFEQSTFDRILIRTQGFTGSSTVRLGVYNNSGGKPTTVAFDAGTVACTANNTAYTITINQTLAAGWYWLAANSQTAAATNVYTGSTTFVSLGIGNFPASGGVNFPSVNYSQTGVTGAFATAGTLVDQNGAPVIALREA